MLNEALPPDFDKKYLIEKFLKIIYTISSKEYQRRVWIEGIGPEVNDFDETYMFLEDCNHFILNHADELGLNHKQKKITANFRKVFCEFSDENDWPPFFIDTPEWTRITEMAQEVLKAFNYIPPK